MESDTRDYLSLAEKDSRVILRHSFASRARGDSMNRNAHRTPSILLLASAFLMLSSYGYATPVQISPGLTIDFQLVNPNPVVGGNDQIKVNAMVINEPFSTANLRGPVKSVGIVFGDLIFNRDTPLANQKNNPYSLSTFYTFAGVQNQLANVNIRPGQSFSFTFATL